MDTSNDQYCNTQDLLDEVSEFLQFPLNEEEYENVGSVHRDLLDSFFNETPINNQTATLSVVEFENPDTFEDVSVNSTYTELTNISTRPQPTGSLAQLGQNIESNIVDYLVWHFKVSSEQKLYATITLEDVGFNAEQAEVFRQCTDPNLRLLMVLNRIQYANVLTCQTKFYKMAQLTKMGLRKTDWENESETSLKRCTVPGPQKLCYGIPYFKNSRTNCAPKNEDYKRMVEEGQFMLLANEVSTAWTAKDHKVLFSAVSENLRESEKVAVERQICYARNRADRLREDSDAQNELRRLERRLVEIKTPDKPLNIPAPDEEIDVDWNAISRFNMKNRHTAFECRIFWNLYLNPRINKSPFSVSEDTQIKHLVKEFGFTQWATISGRLGTDRSGFIVMMHYCHRILVNTRRHQRSTFTPEDDAKILKLVEKHRRKNDIHQDEHNIMWGLIAKSFPNYNRSQLYHRYTYVLQYGQLSKKEFSEAEDVMLKLLVDRLGVANFSQMTSHIPNRSVRQLRHRYINFIQEKIYNREQFSVEEDRILYEYVQLHGEGYWSELAARFNRKSNAVRQRYHIIKKAISKNPDVLFENVERRTKRAAVVRIQKMDERLQHITEIADQIKEDLGSLMPTAGLIQMYLETHRSRHKFVNLKKQSDEEENVLFEQSYGLADKKLIEFFVGVELSEQCTSSVPYLQDEEVRPNAEIIANHMGLADVTTHDSSFRCHLNYDFVVPPGETTLIAFRRLLKPHVEGKRCTKVAPLNTTSLSELAFKRRLFGLLFWPYVLHINRDATKNFDSPSTESLVPVPGPSAKRRKTMLPGGTISGNWKRFNPDSTEVQIERYMPRRLRSRKGVGFENQNDGANWKVMAKSTTGR